MKSVILAIVFYMIIGFLWLSFFEPDSLRNWKVKAAVILPLMAMLNTLILGSLSLKPFNIPALSSPLKTCVQIIMADGFFHLINKFVERCAGTACTGASIANYLSVPELQLLAAYTCCFILILLTGKWWRKNWDFQE